MHRLISVYSVMGFFSDIFRQMNGTLEFELADLSGTQIARRAQLLPKIFVDFLYDMLLNFVWQSTALSFFVSTSFQSPNRIVRF